MLKIEKHRCQIARFTGGPCINSSYESNGRSVGGSQLLRGLGKYELQFVIRTKKIDLFPETEIVTFQQNLPGLRYTCASGPEACGCRSERSLLVANLATPERSAVLPHYCETLFCPDAPLGGQRGDSLRDQVPDYMEVVERSICFWMVSMLRTATCRRALSWRNDTDICAVFL